MHTNIPNRPPLELPAYYESFAWYYPNCELETKDWFVRNAARDWNYIDCGANIGYYSILFSQLSPAGHVYAIEPTTTKEMLCTNLAHHGCANVSVYQQAVGEYSGVREEKIFRIWGQPPEVQTYDFSTIDDFATSRALTRLDCLKIDVDSFDFEVLKGAEKTLERFDPWLVVELNHALGQRGTNNLVALDWLLARGYRYSLVLDHDNFILRRSAPESAFATPRRLALYFPSTQ